jgi:exosortase
MKNLLFNLQSVSKSPNFVPLSLKLSLLVIFPIAAYFQDIVRVFTLALSNEEAQYILLVPFVVAFFFYRSRRAFLVSRENTKAHDLTGISLCLLALLIYVLGSYSFYSLQLHLISLPIFFAGLTLLFFGSKVLRLLIFPTALLSFLSPFPLFFMDVFGGGLMASDGALAALILKPFIPLDITYQPVVILSTVTTAGDPIQFSLSAACSGIYSLTAFLFCAVVFGYLASGSILKKVLYGVFAVLAAYLLNVLRIVVTILLGRFFGLGLAVEFFHAVGGTVLAFIGTLLLLYVGSKLLKLSFIQKKDNKLTSIIPNALPKIKINWKRMAIVLLFLVICADLIIQASAVNYNTVAKSEETAFEFNPTTGELATLSNETGWVATFMGREAQAEEALGLIFVGDYYLSPANSSDPDSIYSIFEVSDLQSKFHTWEGCLNYQAYPITIDKITPITIYENNTNIVNGELIVASAPTLNQTMVLVYWFDTLKLRTNGTVTDYSIKLTLLQYIPTVNNQTDTAKVKATTSQLLSLSHSYEQIWSQYKNSNNSFVVDMYRNKEAFSAVVIAMLVLSIAALLWETFFARRLPFLKEPASNAVLENAPPISEAVAAAEVVPAPIIIAVPEKTATAPVAAKLMFMGVPASLQFDETSEAISVKLLDDDGNPVNAESDITVNLSPQGKWYSDSAGSAPILDNQVIIVSGLSISPSFYFKNGAINATSLNIELNEQGASYSQKRDTSVSVWLSASSENLTSAVATLIITPKPIEPAPQIVPPPLIVETPTVDHLVITPNDATIVAGDSQEYSTEAFDENNNSLGKVNALYSVEGATVNENIISANVVGSYVVTGLYMDKSVNATLTVIHAEVSKVEITPADASVKAGETTKYTALACDAYGNTWDLASEAVWSIDPEAGGSWNNNNYTSAKAGSWTVKGTYNNQVFTTSLTVNPANVARFSISTVGAITSGLPFDLIVRAVDAFNNTVTSYTGTSSLSCSTGTINPSTTGAFSEGVWSGPVTVSGGSSGFVILTTDGTHSGMSKLISVDMHTISHTMSAFAGVGGVISPSDSLSVKRGDSKSFKVTANPGYRIVDVLVDGISVLDSIVDGNFTVSNVNKDTSIVASFEAISCDVTVNVGPNGSCNLASQTIDCNSTLNFVFTPNLGYHVSDVVVNGSSVGSVTSLDLEIMESTSVDVSFALDTFPITVNEASNGSITGPRSVSSSDDATYTIVPSVGYHIVDVVVDEVSKGAVNTYVFSNVHEAHTISAIFAIDTFTISASAGAGGTISPDGTLNVDYGGSQTFTISANTGYHLVDVLADGASVLSSVADGKYTVSEVTKDLTISATFAINTYNVTVNVGTNGSSNLASQTVDGESKLDFVFTPEERYHVSEVLVNGKSVGPEGTLSLTITEETSVEVRFAIDTYDIAITQSDNGLISGPASVNSGDDAVFTVAPSTGYYIVDVVVDGASVGAVNSHTITDVVATHSITAIFAINTYSISVSAGSNGVISPNGSVSVDYGSEQAFTFTPDAHYHVADVLVDGFSVGAVTSYTFRNIAADHTISVSFAIDTFAISASAGAGGNISPSGYVDVNYGGTQSFTITPYPHYHIEDVSVDGSSVGAVDSYTFQEVKADHSINVIFAIETFNIIASVGAGGAISPSGLVSVDYGSSQSFTITANEGYHIVAVIVDNASQGAVSNKTNVEAAFTNVTAGHMITAIFAVDTFKISASAGPGGAISPSGSVNVNFGANQSFSIRANAGYCIVDIVVDGVSQGAISPHTSNVQADFNNVHADHTITVVFAVDA